MRGLLRNVAILEQLCSAPAGSVRGYAGGRAQHETDCRSPQQIDLCAAVRGACLAFLNFYPDLVEKIGSDPLADPERARGQAAVLLTRLLLLPVPEEMRQLGDLRHDINLGSRAVVRLLDRPSAERALDAMAFSKVCTIGEPPMWLAASLGAVSPAFGHAYCMNAFGLLPGDVFADLAETEIQVAIIKEGAATPLQVSCLRTGFGDTRLRIPVRRQHTGSTVAVAVGDIAPASIVKALTLQCGESAREALDSQDIEVLAPAEIRGLRARIDGRHFQATAAEAYLLFPIPLSDHPLTILTVTLSTASPPASDAPPPQATAAA
jgi:hypothetical protein